MNRIDVVFSNRAGNRTTTWEEAEALLLQCMRAGWLPAAARNLLPPSSIFWTKDEPLWVAEARDEAACQRMVGHLYSGVFSSFSRLDGLKLAEVLRELASFRARPGRFEVEEESPEPQPDLGPDALLEWADFLDARQTSISVSRNPGSEEAHRSTGHSLMPPQSSGGQLRGQLDSQQK
jgi:hypothetical protein